jgi:antitoxin VapB
VLPDGPVHDHIGARCLVTPRTSHPARLAKTAAVNPALQNELRRLDNALPLREQLRPIQDRVLARPTTGLLADKLVHLALNGRT